MNLSCGKCRVVRPFSGDPLKCDICGWVCEPIDPNQASDTEYWQHLRKVRQTPLTFDTDTAHAHNPRRYQTASKTSALSVASKSVQRAVGGCIGGLVGGVGVILIFGFMVVVAIGALWAFIALVKWFWYHS
jgi:hypothetical protein